MAKFRLRKDCGFKFIVGERATDVTIVDDTHPDFAGQAYKFEPVPVSEEVAVAYSSAKVAGALEEELKRISEMQRTELVALYTQIKGGPPPEGLDKRVLKAILAEVATGLPILEAETSVLASEKATAK